MPKIYYILVPNIFTYFETYQYFGHFLNLKKDIYVCVYKHIIYIYIYISANRFRNILEKIIIIYIHILGMGRFPIRSVHRQKKLPIRCIGLISVHQIKLTFVSRCIVSNIFALVKNDLFIYNYYILSSALRMNMTNHNSTEIKERLKSKT